MRNRQLLQRERRHPRQPRPRPQHDRVTPVVPAQGVPHPVMEHLSLKVIPIRDRHPVQVAHAARSDLLTPPVSAMTMHRPSQCATFDATAFPKPFVWAPFGPFTAYASGNR